MNSSFTPQLCAGVGHILLDIYRNVCQAQTNSLLINMTPQERVFLGKYSTQTTVSAPVNLNEGDNADHAAQIKLFSREECYKTSMVVYNLPAKLYHLGSCRVQCISTVTRSWFSKLGALVS